MLVLGFRSSNAKGHLRANHTPVQKTSPNHKQKAGTRLRGNSPCSVKIELSQAKRVNRKHISKLTFDPPTSNAHSSHDIIPGRLRGLN